MFTYLVNILHILMFLMTSGLIYLPRESEKLPALEYVKDAIRALQTSTMERFAKTVSNVNLKMLTVLAKRHILDS